MTARSNSDLAADVRTTIEFLDSCICSAEPLTETVMAMESDGLAALAELVARLEAAEAALPKGREGMVTAHDDTGAYVGCIGRDTWRWLIESGVTEAQVAALTQERDAWQRTSRHYESIAANAGLL